MEEKKFCQDFYRQILFLNSNSKDKIVMRIWEFSVRIIVFANVERIAKEFKLIFLSFMKKQRCLSILRGRFSRQLSRTEDGSYTRLHSRYNNFHIIIGETFHYIHIYIFFFTAVIEVDNDKRWFYYTLYQNNSLGTCFVTFCNRLVNFWSIFTLFACNEPKFNCIIFKRKEKNIGER